MDKPRELNIFDLNDDCLIKIIEYLDFNDILNLSKINLRFNEAIGASLTKTAVNISNENLGEMEVFLKIFGGQVKHMDILGIEPSNQAQVKELIRKYCNIGKVEHCTLNGLNIKEDFLETNINFFKSLKTLIMPEQANIETPIFYRILDTMTNIKYLDVNFSQCVRRDVPTLLSKLVAHQLETLYLLNMSNVTENDINNSPKLNSLNELATDQVLFLMCFPNIKKLQFLFFERPSSIFSLSPILDLLHLKELSLFSLHEKPELYSLLSQLADRNALESLTLCLLNTDNDEFTYNAFIDFEANFDIIHVLSRFTKLKSLNLQANWQLYFRLFYLVEQLPELCHLNIGEHERTFKDMLSINGLICGIIGVAKSLNSLYVRMPDLCNEFNSDIFHQFYKSFSNIRENQSNKALLKVRLYKNKEEPKYGYYYQENKRLAMETPWKYW